MKNYTLNTKLQDYIFSYQSQHLNSTNHTVLALITIGLHNVLTKNFSRAK